MKKFQFFYECLGIYIQKNLSIFLKIFVDIFVPTPVMLGKRKLNQIENDDWNNSNDSESEIVTVKKRVTKRSKLKNIDECKIDSKIAQESIRKKIIKQTNKIFQCTVFKFQIKEEKYKYAIIMVEMNFRQYR